MGSFSSVVRVLWQVRLWEDLERDGCWRQACCARVEDPAMCVTFSADASLLATGVLTSQ
jgi:hypothetical protein